MTLKEVTNKKKLHVGSLFLLIPVLLLAGCTVRTSNDSVNIQDEVESTEEVEVNEEIESIEAELPEIDGLWRVTEYLGESVGYYGAEPTTKEEIELQEKRVSAIKGIYIGRAVVIDNENTRLYPPIKSGYNPFTSWEELFCSYEQPESWEWASAPFFSINIYNKNDAGELYSVNDINGNGIDYISEKYYHCIVDGTGNVILYARGSFFRMINIGEKLADPLSKIEGKWHVAEYLGESIEYHGAEPTTEEEIASHEKHIYEIKETYLGTNIEINNENVLYAYAPWELGYYCVDWDDLFTLKYRPSGYIWDEIEYPIFCISLEYKEDDSYLDILVDNDGHTTLFVRGLFFRLEKRE